MKAQLKSVGSAIAVALAVSIFIILLTRPWGPEEAQQLIKTNGNGGDNQSFYDTKLTDWLVLGAILLQALIYWKQARIMLDQLKATARQIALAREQFTAAHRPLLVIHSVRLLPSLTGTPPDHQPLCAEFAVVNAGTSDCVVTGSAAYLEYLYPTNRPHLPTLVQNNVIRPRTYRVGDTDNAIPVKTDECGGANHLKVEVDETAYELARRRDIAETILNPPPQSKVLYLSGWVTYREGSKDNVRTTYFRRSYSHQRERFVPSNEPDDESTY